MNIDDIHNFILLLANKEQTSWMTPAEIDSYIHRAQIDEFNKWAPLYGKDETATKACDPFKTKFTINGATSPGGLITLPGYDATNDDDPTVFMHLLGGVIVSYDNTVNPSTGQPYGTKYWPMEFVGDDELADRLNSQLKPVTPSTPVAQTVGQGEIQLWPQQPNGGWLFYLAVPIAPVAYYSQTGRVLTYQAGQSTQLQWNEAFITPIIARACKYLGINMDYDRLVQYMTNLN